MCLNCFYKTPARNIIKRYIKRNATFHHLIDHCAKFKLFQSFHVPSFRSILSGFKKIIFPLPELLVFEQLQIFKIFLQILDELALKNSSSGTFAMTWLSIDTYKVEISDKVHATRLGNAAISDNRKINDLIEHVYVKFDIVGLLFRKTSYIQTGKHCIANIALFITCDILLWKIGLFLSKIVMLWAMASKYKLS